MMKKNLVALSLAPIIGLVVLYILNLSTSLIPIATVEQKIKDGFQDGSISDTDWPYIEIPGYKGSLGYDQFMDCLVYMSTVLGTGDRFYDAITANVIYWRPELSKSTRKTWTRCGTLQDAVEKSNYEELRPYYYPYHRYLFGHKPVAALAISATSVATLKNTFEYVIYGVLFVTLLFATKCLLTAKAWKQSTEFEINRNAFFPGAIAIMTVFFVLFYGLDYYVRSISHAMSDLVLFIFLLIALRFDMLRVKDSIFVILMSGFGVLTAFFELLNGSIPIGAALVVLAIGLRVSSVNDFKQANIRIATGLLLFLGTLTLILLFKQAVAEVFFPHDEVFGAFIKKLVERTAGPVRNQYGGEFSPSTSDMYNGLFEQIGFLAFGSRKLGLSLLVLSACLLFFAGAVITIRGLQIERYYLFIVLLANAVPVAWLAVFKQHATEHPMYMVRILIIAMASGWIIALVFVRRLGIHKRLTHARGLVVRISGSAAKPPGGGEFGSAREFRTDLFRPSLKSDGDRLRLRLALSHAARQGTCPNSLDHG